MPSQSPNLEFNYDISCPFAYIASTRISSLSHRTSTPISYRPVLLGAIYRATSAPQGAAGSASDVFNSTKKNVTAQSMKRTLKRYKIAYNPPVQHPRKSVDALRLLYCVPDMGGKDGAKSERRVLSEAFFRAYWVDNVDVTNREELLRIARESGIPTASKLNLASFEDKQARKSLEDETAKAIERGAFGVPGFWIEGVKWRDVGGEEQVGRYFWGQDRMHFVEATLLALSSSSTGSSRSTITLRQAEQWSKAHDLLSLMPRCIPCASQVRSLPQPTRLEFFFDFSSPWAYLGYTQLSRLQTTYPSLQIVLKPFLLGILFREIGAPNLPMAAVSATKAAWSRQDHGDWVDWWNAVGMQSGNGGRGAGKSVEFTWAENFPIRTPTVLRVGIVDESTTPLLCKLSNTALQDRTTILISQ